ncbi:MAG TPA: alcohol dehydrogenase catalytic domain-containing protein [Victivallales bacterium]|nr:alcohol dehydrogenase catalytic domain-containing protein [Victivallales bacterium]
MKACFLTGIRKLEIRDIPKPEIKSPDEVLLRIKSVGVCGSDVHYYQTGRIGDQIVKFPFPLGHECAGIVEGIGASVANLKVGDKVAVDPAMSCGKCDQCLAGRENTCRNLRFLGCPEQAPGCLSEFIVMPSKSCIKIPEKMSYEDAVISEPLAIGLYAVKKSVPMKSAKIAVLGVGPIGISVLTSARLHGAAKAYVTDKIDDRLKMAERFSADWTGNPDKEDIVASISSREPLLLDAVFECCGSQEAVLQGLKLLKPGGKLMIVGIPPQLDFWSIPVHDTRRNEICIQNVRRQMDCTRAALEMISEKKINFTNMITHRFPIEKSQDAFELVAGYRDGVVKAMINL